MLFLGDSTFNDADFSETVFPIEADSAVSRPQKDAFSMLGNGELPRLRA